MLTRVIARPLLATWFVAEGVDALRRPAPHAERTRDVWQALAARTELPQPPPDARLRTIVRVHGAATAAAGILLALGKAPRLAACSLALLTVPLAVVDAPDHRTSRSRAASSSAGERPLKALQRDLSLIGAAALAGLDRQGRPSLCWRMQHARADRDTRPPVRRPVSTARKKATD